MLINNVNVLLNVYYYVVVISSDNSLLLAFSSMWVGTLHSTATELQIQALGLLESAWTFL